LVRSDQDTVRVLTLTTLYPNAIQPNHGIFVHNRLCHTLALGGLSAVVVASVPYFPFRSAIFGRYAGFANVPREETRDGVRVLHPRVAVIPKIGMMAAPYLHFRTLRRAYRALRRDGLSFDVIDAHYFYPDGVAAALLGKTLGLPVVITGRGSDLTLIPHHPLARRQIQWAASQASGLVTVCQSLKDSLIALGAEPDRISVLRNGVDLERFKPSASKTARARLARSGPVLLSVGSLIPRKGHDIVLRALRMLDGCSLVIAGAGPMRPELEALARSLGVADRVTMAGEVPHERLAEIYSSADVMVLASAREGMPNVLLESLACGTPVVATNVDGVREIIQERCAGRLVAARTPEAVAAAVRSLLEDPPNRGAVRHYAEQFSWRATAIANRSLLRHLAGKD
jgi:glycosyltransferase involved in cell wall biosynthesis